MKIKPLVLVGCLAAGALIASPATGKPAKKSTGTSVSKPKRMAPQTTQVMRNQRHKQNISARTSSTRFAGRQLAATRYYGGTRYYGNYYGGGTRFYSGGYPSYSYYSGGPYSNWGYGRSWGYYPYSYWGGYPYSGYSNYYSYYTPRYGYDGSTVAAVQQRLGELGYYRGAVDGVAGPRTRTAIAAFESRHGLVVDGMISRSLLDRLGLA